MPISWSAAGRYVPASANQKEEKTWTISILDSLNYLAIIVGVVINQMLGAAWYRTWGKPWMTDVGITMEDVEAMKGTSQQWLPYVVAIASSLVFTFVLALLLQGIDARWSN